MAWALLLNTPVREVSHRLHLSGVSLEVGLDQAQENLPISSKFEKWRKSLCVLVLMGMLHQPDA